MDPRLLPVDSPIAYFPSWPLGCIPAGHKAVPWVSVILPSAEIRMEGGSVAVFVLEEPEADCFFDHRGGVVYVRVWQIQGNLAGLSGEPYRKFLSSENN